MVLNTVDIDAKNIGQSFSGADLLFDLPTSSCVDTWQIAALVKNGELETFWRARREALRLLGLKAAGNDPAALRDRQKSAVTIAELADRFLREHVARHCKPRTVEEYQRSVEYFIKPGLSPPQNHGPDPHRYFAFPSPAPRPPVPGEPILGRAVENDELGRGLGAAHGWEQPMPTREEVPREQAGAVSHEGRAAAPWHRDG